MSTVVINGFQNYTISNCGNVTTIKTGKIRKPRNNGIGYMQVDLFSNGKSTNKYLHKLVAEHFLNALPSDEINHKDGNKSNCHVSNLEICSHSTNIKHAECTGLIKRDLLGKFV